MKSFAIEVKRFRGTYRANVTIDHRPSTELNLQDLDSFVGAVELLWDQRLGDFIQFHSDPCRTLVSREG